MDEKYKEYIDKLIAKGKDESAIRNFMNGLGYEDPNEYLPYYNSLVKKKDDPVSSYDSSYQPASQDSPSVEEEQLTVSDTQRQPKNQFAFDQNWMVGIKEKAFIEFMDEQYEGFEQKPDLKIEWGETETEDGKKTYVPAYTHYDEVMDAFTEATPQKPLKKEVPAMVKYSAGEPMVARNPYEFSSWESPEETYKRIRKEKETAYRDKVRLKILEALPEEVRNDEEALKDLEQHLRVNGLEEFDLSGDNEIGNMSFGEQMGSKFKSGTLDAVAGVLNIIPSPVYDAYAQVAQYKATEERQKQNIIEQNITESIVAGDYGSAAKQMLYATSEAAPLVGASMAATFATGNPYAGAVVASSIATSSEELRTRGDKEFYEFVNDETGETIPYDEGVSKQMFGELEGFELRRDDLSRATYLGSVFATEIVSEYFTGKIGLDAVKFDPTGKSARRAFLSYAKGMGVSIPQEAVPEMLAEIGSSVTYDLTTKGETRTAKEYFEEGVETFLSSAAMGPSIRFLPSSYTLAKDMMGRGNKWTQLPVNISEKTVKNIANGFAVDEQGRQEIDEFFTYARGEKLKESERDVAFYEHIERTSPSDFQELGRISALYTHNRRQAEKAKDPKEKAKYQERMNELEKRRVEIESRYESAYATSMENTVYDSARQTASDLRSEIVAIDEMIGKLEEAQDTEFYDEAEVATQRLLKSMLEERLADLQGYISRVESAGDSYGTELFSETDYMQAFEELAAFLNVPLKVRPAQVVDTKEAGTEGKVPDGRKLFSEPDERLSPIADEYIKSNGLKPMVTEKITSLDEERSKAIADIYEEAEDQSDNPEVQKAYQALADETKKQYDALIAAGYTVEVWENDGQPYNNSQEMLADLRNNKHLYIFGTESGFGESGITAEDRAKNPMLADSGAKDANGKTLLVNDMFRFVHDAFGHGKLGNSFGPIGEENAWRVHSQMYSPLARRAMTSETRGQNSWVNFGPHLRGKDGKLPKKGEDGYVPVSQRPYAPQKNFLFPDQYVFDEYSPAQREEGDAPQKKETKEPKENTPKQSPAYKGGAVRTFGKFNSEKAKLANTLIKALSFINPDLQVVIHRDQKTMGDANAEAKAVIESGTYVEGFYDGDKTVHLMDTTDTLTIIEEFLHAATPIFRDPATRSKLMQELEALAKTDKDISKILESRRKEYGAMQDQDAVEEEAVVGYLREVISAAIDSKNRTFIQKVIDWVNKTFFSGKKVILSDVSLDLVAKAFSDAVVRGQRIVVDNGKRGNPYSDDPARFSVRPETSKSYAHMTEDGQGNFVFYHNSNAKFGKLDPKLVGKNTYTSSEEASAFAMAGGVSMFYSQPDRAEPQVKGKYSYMFKVPKEKVYDFNADPNGYLAEAKKRFKDRNPNAAFTPNHQVAFVTQVANENGFDIVVSEWNDKYGPRAHTTLELSPTDYAEYNGSVITKTFKEAHQSNRMKGWVVQKAVNKKDALDDLYTRMQRSFPYGEYPPLYRAIAMRSTKQGMPDQREMTSLVLEADIPESLKREYFHLKDLTEVGPMSVKQYEEFKSTEEFRENFAKWEQLPEGYQSIFTLPDTPFSVDYVTNENGTDVQKKLNFNSQDHFMMWLGQNIDSVQQVGEDSVPRFRSLTYDGSPIHVGAYSRIGDARFSLAIKRAGGIRSEQVSDLLGARLAKKVREAGKRDMTKRFAGVIFNKLAPKLYGSVPKDVNKLLNSPRAMNKIASIMADELQWMMEESAAAGIPKSGYGWYSDYYDETIKKINDNGILDLSTQESQDFFTAILAVTSNQEKLYRNIEVSVALFKGLYQGYVENGVLDEDFLNRAERSNFATKNTKDVIKKLRLYGTILNHFGGIESAKEFMLSTVDTNEIKEILDKDAVLGEAVGKKANGSWNLSFGYLVDEKVPVSAYLFGPKLGMFFANLSKDYQWLTMDRWWSRSFNRYRGTMLPNVSLDKLRSVLNDYKSSDQQLLNRVEKLSEKYRKSGFKKEFATPVAVAANTIFKTAFSELNDSPSGGKERRAMMLVAKKAAEEMQSRGYDFTIANVQEVIWFYEKYLFRDMEVSGPAVADYSDEMDRVVEKLKEDPNFLDVSKVLVSGQEAKNSRYAGVKAEWKVVDNSTDAMNAEAGASYDKGDKPSTRFSLSPTEDKVVGAETSPFYKGERDIVATVPVSTSFSATAQRGLTTKSEVPVGTKVTVSLDQDMLHGDKSFVYNIFDQKGHAKSQQVVRLSNATFSVNQDLAAETRNSFKLHSEPMYSLQGEYQQTTGEEKFEGIELEFNPLMDDGFVDPSGRVVEGADAVTIIDGKVYASGNVRFSARKPVEVSPFDTDREDNSFTPQQAERFQSYMRLMGVEMAAEEAGNYFSSMSKEKQNRFAAFSAGKRRRFADRMIDAVTSSQLKKMIEANPQNYYQKQSIGAIRENLSYMSEAELVNKMKQDALYTLFTGNDDISVLAGIELLNRALDNGDYDAADTIVAQLATMGTTAGRTLRHFAEMPSSTPKGMSNFVTEAVNRAGKELSPEQQDKLDDLTKRYFEAYRELNDILNRLANGEDLEADLKAKQKEMEGIQRELDSFVNPLMEDTWMELFATIMQGNLLTPTSQVINVTANLGTILLNIPLKLMTGSTGMLLRAAGVDTKIPPVSFSAYYYAVQRGVAGVGEALHQIRTGQELGDYEFRVSRGLMPVRSLIAGLTGNGVAMSESKAAEINQRMKLVMKGTFGIPAEIMFRFLSLGDIPFKRFEEGLYAASMGKRIGLEGDALKQFVKFPPQEVAEQAADEGRKVTFQNESRTYRITQSVMDAVANSFGPNGSKVMNFMLRVVMPFRKTPANILEETLTYASPVIGIGKTAAALNRGDYKSAVEAISKVFLGQMVYMGVDVLIANGLISLPIGMDEEERNLAYETFPPSSINVSALRRLLDGDSPEYQSDDYFVRYDRIGTLGVLMGARTVATPKEQAVQNVEASKVMNPLSSIFGLNELSTLSYMMDQSYLQGINGFLSMLTYRGSNQFERQASDWFETSFRAISAIPMPNTLSAMHRAEREYMPDYRSASMVERMNNIIKDRTFNYFGVAEQLPVRVDWKGEPIKQTPQGNYPFVYNMIDPFKTRQGSDDPVALEALNIFNETGEVINVVSIPKFARAAVVRNIPSMDKLGAKQKLALRRLKKDYKFLSEPKEDFVPILTAEESNRLISIANREKYNEALEFIYSRNYDRMGAEEKLKEFARINERFNSAIEVTPMAKMRNHTKEYLDIIEQKYNEQYN